MKTLIFLWKDDSCENQANDADCNEWVTRGECQNNPDWMNINCAKACEQCEHPGKPCEYKIDVDKRIDVGDYSQFRIHHEKCSQAIHIFSKESANLY